MGDLQIPISDLQILAKYWCRFGFKVTKWVGQVQERENNNGKKSTAYGPRTRAKVFHFSSRSFWIIPPSSMSRCSSFVPSKMINNTEFQSGTQYKCSKSRNIKNTRRMIIGRVCVSQTNKRSHPLCARLPKTKTVRVRFYDSFERKSNNNGNPL